MAPKNNTHKQSEQEKLDFFDEIKESTYFQWLLENAKYTPYFFGALLLAIALIFKFSSSKSTKTESDYFLAENYVQQLTQSLRGDGDAENIPSNLEKLTAITNNYPELRSRYDGLIAQLLLTMGNEKESHIYATRTLERIQIDNAPEYAAFSATTLKIGEKSYKQALDESKSLQKLLMEKNGNTLSGHPANSTANLFVYNLLRIALLEKEAGTPQGEKTAWATWQTYATQTENPVFEEAFLTLNKHLKEGTFSLKQYIESRELALKKEL